MSAAISELIARLERFPDPHLHEVAAILRGAELELFTVRALSAQLIAALLSAKKDLETAQREIKGVAPEASAPSLPTIRAAMSAYEDVEAAMEWVK